MVKLQNDHTEKCASHILEAWWAWCTPQRRGTVDKGCWEKLGGMRMLVVALASRDKNRLHKKPSETSWLMGEGRPHQWWPLAQRPFIGLIIYLFYRLSYPCECRTLYIRAWATRQYWPGQIVPLSWEGRRKAKVRVSGVDEPSSLAVALPSLLKKRDTSWCTHRGLRSSWSQSLTSFW